MDSFATEVQNWDLGDISITAWLWRTAVGFPAYYPPGK